LYSITYSNAITQWLNDEGLKVKLFYL